MIRNYSCGSFDVVPFSSERSVSSQEQETPLSSSLSLLFQETVTQISSESIPGAPIHNLTHIEGILQEWVDAAPNSLRDDYIEAQRRILAFLENSCLLSVGSESVICNQLSLEQLKIESLPEGIGSYPAFKNLTILNLKDCSHLRTIAQDFLSQCTALQRLFFSGCSSLETPPDLSQCRALQELFLDWCTRLETPPDLSQCRALQKLSFASSSLVTPPDLSRCRALQKLSFAVCSSLVILPDLSQCRALRNLSLVRCVGLTGLPDSIASLSSRCTIDITNCRFSDHVLENLNLMTREGGPRISYSQTYTDLVGDLLPLEESLHFVYERAGESSWFYFTLLEGTRPEDVAHQEHLRNWLHRLRWTAEGGAREIEGTRSQEFYRNVARNLDEAELSKEFRPVFWANVEEGCTTCGDRVSLSLLKMGLARERLRLKEQPLEAVWGVLKRAWAIDLLEECAREKVPTLRFFDEVEVYLGYPIQLNKRLGLALDVEEMRFYGCSCLTDQDLLAAEEYVKMQWESQEAAVSYLIEQVEWIDALERSNPEEMQKLKNFQEQIMKDTIGEAEVVRIHGQRKKLLEEMTLLALDLFRN